MMTDSEYRHYSIAVRTYTDEKITIDHMHITAAGLKPLLEMRRIHIRLLSTHRSAFKEDFKSN